MSTGNGRKPGRWLALARAGLGYTAFAAALSYGLYRAPMETWHIRLIWLLPALLVILFTIVLQVLQVRVFLRHHGAPGGWFWPSLFTVRKAVLNILLPARSGTLVLLPMLTGHYKVRWHDYVKFSLCASLSSAVISVLGLLAITLNVYIFFAVLVFVSFGIVVLRRYSSRCYLDSVYMLIAIAACLFFSFVLTFWCLLNGMGMGVGFKESAYFAVVVNTLALVSITPGNLGVREALLGVVAPYISLPVSSGILAGAVLYVTRVAVAGVLLIVMEMYLKRSGKKFVVR